MQNTTSKNIIRDYKGSGGQILVETLYAHGVDKIATVAGESYLPVLDALLDRPEIKVYTCRQEGGAGFMAESWGKLSGRPGICFVTRGPGICNASIAIHTARQDATPMIVFMGQVRRMERGRDAFQEVDVRAVFGTLAKWATEIDDLARIPEIVNQAFKIALSGRQGPVVIGLPEDMLSQITETVLRPPTPELVAAPRLADIEDLQARLNKAERPMLLVGGSGWTAEGIAAMSRFAEQADIPVAVAFRNHDLFDHRHDCYAGELGTGPNPMLVERVGKADLLLVVGSRLDEITTRNYTLLHDGQDLIHIYPEAEDLGRVYTPVLGIAADVNISATMLAGLPSGKAAGGAGKWAQWRAAARHDYLQWSNIDAAGRPDFNGGDFNGADMTLVFGRLRHLLPRDAIITTDAGNFSGWAQRYLQYGRPNRLLAPISGAMGYSVPAAIGASIAHPDRLVLGICGDGGFMMNGQELATAMHHGATPIIMICNNGMYGTIRMHQEQKYPGRISATGLTNPDFVRLAQSYGAFGARVDRAEQFDMVWNAALESKSVAVIEIAMDPAQITTRI